MKKARISFYILMAILNVLPFIPMSVKGILGLLFIIISCIKLSLKDGLYTATLWVVFGFMNFFLGINVDYKLGLTTMLLGSSLYYITAVYFGKSIESKNAKTDALKCEIKKRIDTEKELREKLTILQSLMDTIPSPIFFKDLDCRYMGCNRAFESSIGVSEKEIIGKTPQELVETELAATYYTMDLELMKNMNRQVYETNVKYADGSLRNIIFSKALFNDDTGNPAGIVGVMTDITDKKESEKLKQSIDEILEHDKMKTEFFSNISHELRTPLNVILGAIQLMNIYTKDNLYYGSQEKVVRNIAIMKQNCYRLLRLVNNLIDITRIDAHAFEIQLRNCNIVSIIEDITLSVSDYIENKGITLVFDTDAEEKIIACDDEKIERIMLNLLSNAVKFTPSGGSIYVNICDKADTLCISIRDTGIGIPSEKQDEIFKRFCQIDSMFTRQHEGSGIGLNLVKSLVEMHGGTICVESEPHNGTTFIISLPVRTVEEKINTCKAPSKQPQVEKISVEFSDIYSDS